MPEVVVSIGGREFEVACQEGEEHFLKSAAQLLDNEATVLSTQIGRLPAERMLLMAGLMLADKTASVEDRNRDLQNQLAEKEAELDQLRDAPPQQVEVPVVPEAVTETLAELAARAESVAAAIEEKAAG